MQLIKTTRFAVLADIYLQTLNFKQFVQFGIIRTTKSTLYRLRVGPLHLDIEMTRKQVYQGLETKSR